MRRRIIHSLLRITLVLLLTITPASFLVWAGYRWPDARWGIADGHTLVAWPGPNTELPYEPAGPFVNIRGHPVYWRILWQNLFLPSWHRPSAQVPSNIIRAPLWPLILLNAAALVWSYRRSRHLPNHCPKCHYNLRGLPPSPNGQISCPECGKHHASVK